MYINNILYVNNKMKTRSQTKYELCAPFEVIINFNEASEEWKKNKISIGNGSYNYICCNKNSNSNRNKICKYKCLPGENYCKKHF